MPSIPDFFPKRSRTVFLALGGLALAVAIWFARGFWQPPEPLPVTPALALESLEAKSLYFNGGAHSWLLERRPDLLAAEDRDLGSERTRGLAQAVQNPKLFRQLDRKYRF